MRAGEFDYSTRYVFDGLCHTIRMEGVLERDELEYGFGLEFCSRRLGETGRFEDTYIEWTDVSEAAAAGPGWAVLAIRTFAENALDTHSELGVKREVRLDRRALNLDVWATSPIVV
jgi:hypothetical protein